jgi:hypothetical protein
VIDDIDQELRDHPARFGDRNIWPILILQFRFGVNHFWDVAAWRRWWAEYQAVTVSPSVKTANRDADGILGPWSLNRPMASQ